VESPMDVGAQDDGGGSGAAGEDDKDESEWTNNDYKAALADVGLPVSGNKDDLTARWEEYKAQEAEYAEYQADDWKTDIEDVETADDLASLRAAYDRSGADYSTVVTAFDERQAELSDGS